jgi:hypothetical protein
VVRLYLDEEYISANIHWLQPYTGAKIGLIFSFEDSKLVLTITFFLRINLDKVERAFPYVVTCGREIC